MPATTAPRLWDLAEIVRSGRAREGTPRDAVQNVQPRFVIEPGTTDEAAQVLRVCSGHDLAVVVRGTGTKLGWGSAPERVDVVLATARMDAILEHSAGDLVVRAQPGVRLAALQSRLSGDGQMLALDPPERGAGATLGGIVAAGASGPRRLRYGTPRDMLIGITVVLSDGTVARAGGKVVKNVAGYDLCKLFAGSFGTLGLIAELTFRLHPRPEASRVLEVEVANPDAALTAARLMTSTSLVPSAVELTWPSAEGPGMVKGLYEGFEPGVQAQAERAFALLGHPATQGLGPPVMSNAWIEDAEPEPAPAPATDAATSVRVKLTHPPAALPEAMRAAWATAGVVRLWGHAASGVLFADIDLDLGGGVGGRRDFAGPLAGLRAFAASVGGSAVVLGAPEDIARSVDVWGPAGDALDLMRRVKARFDPTRTLSPGRFVGGI